MPPENQTYFFKSKFNPAQDAFDRMLFGVTESPRFLVSTPEITEAAVPAAAIAQRAVPYILPIASAAGNYISSPENFAHLPHDFSNWLGDRKGDLQILWYNTLGYRPSMPPVTADTYLSYLRPVERTDAIAARRPVNYVEVVLPSILDDMVNKSIGKKLKLFGTAIATGVRVARNANTSNSEEETPTRTISQEGTTVGVTPPNPENKPEEKPEEKPTNKPDNKPTEDKKPSGNDKKPFWKTRWGKTIKGVGIGLGIGGALDIGIPTARNFIGNQSSEDNSSVPYFWTKAGLIPIYKGNNFYPIEIEYEDGSTETITREHPEYMKYYREYNKPNVTPVKVKLSNSGKITSDKGTVKKEEPKKEELSTLATIQIPDSISMEDLIKKLEIQP